MKFGISTFVTDEGIVPGVLATAVEDRGFDSLFVAEHTHIPLSRKSPWPRSGELPRRYYRTLDPFGTLTAAAAATGHLLLGTGVALVVERDPIITAKEVASLDLVSVGRVIFGVGVGWNREEMENHGTNPRTRGKLTDERILSPIRAISSCPAHDVTPAASSPSLTTKSEAMKITVGSPKPAKTCS
jgi:alkanesulfonate monooxygenase SsuD/methylene tetrahydromethanopterin reductase-like flavin-dependent oxidoreductase (luciferase family)